MHPPAQRQSPHPTCRVRALAHLPRGQHRVNTTFDVRIWRVLTNKNRGGTTYTVRWLVGHKQWRETFTTSALADSFRAKLLTATREGKAFDLATGLPAEHAGE